jgi:serine/threonine-protein kinase
MGDVRLELEEALATAAGESLEPGPPRPQSSRARFWVPWLVAAALGIVAAFALWKPRGAEVAPAARPSRLSVLLPPGDRLAVDARPALAISPDGSLLAYAAERQGAAGLFLRRLDATASTLLPGTEDASHPFFSPDGRWIGFSASRKLKKVSIGGGAPVTICEAVNLRGASWASDDTIVFTPATREGLFRVAAAGGVPQRLTSPDSENRDYDHRWPQVLPDGGILYSKWAPWQGSDARKIWTADPAAREGKPLADQVEFGRILHNRMLAFVRSGALFVAPFDPETRSLAGPARPLPDSVYVTTNTGAAHFDVSRTGTLAYVPGGPPTDRTLVWRELDGPETPLGAPKRAYLGADLSPDGSRVVVAIEATSRDLWLYDISRRTLTRLTFEGDNAFPIWSPDGRQIAFASREKDGAYNLLRLAADGSQPPERLSRSASTQIPVAFAPDGRFLVFGQARGASQADIYLLPLTGERTPRPLFDSPFDERWGRVSPDGGRIAYVSDESGIDQVYVQSFPNRGGKVQVSTDGGRDPIWSPDGRTLIYTNGDRWLSAGIGPGPAPETSSPRLLFEARYERPPGPLPNYDLSPDGRRILTIKGAAPPDAISQIVVVQNWFDELRRLDSAAARGSRPVP